MKSKLPLNSTALTLVAVQCLASLVVWTAAIARWQRTGEIIPYHERPETRFGPFVGPVVIAWLLFVLTVNLWAGDVPWTPQRAELQLKGSIYQNVVLIPVLLALITGGGRYSLSEYGIFRPGFVRGLHTYLLAVGPVFAVLVASQFLRTPETKHGLLRLLQADSSATTVALIVLAVVVLAPLGEELLYRVTLQGWLGTFVSHRAAILIAAVIFSINHGWPDALAIFPLAVVLGYVYHRRHSYIAVVVAHATFNATQLLLQLIAGGDA